MGWLDKLFGRSTPVIAAVTLPPAANEETVFGDQPMRKQWAEDVLRAESVPVNPHLPMTESESQITLRTPREIADRLRALSIIAALGSGLPQAGARRLIEERGVGPHLSPAERAFLDTADPSPRDQVQFSWRYEAAWVLFWSLGYVEDHLGAPRDTCDVDAMTDIIINTPDLDRQGARSANDVLNEADLIYRYHWAVRQAGIDGKDPPGGLNPGVVMERHHALNWLIGYDESAEWDDVATDT